MPKITYIDADGIARAVDVKQGATVMEGAVRNGVPGIVAECGGAMSCATCHVYVDDTWLEKTGHPKSEEKTMLDYAEGVQPNSRLACQIKVTDALDGLVVRTPASQG